MPPACQKVVMVVVVVRQAGRQAGQQRWKKKNRPVGNSFPRD